jgi:hypothetical protein
LLVERAPLATAYLARATTDFACPAAEFTSSPATPISSITMMLQ